MSIKWDRLGVWLYPYVILTTVRMITEVYITSMHIPLILTGAAIVAAVRLFKNDLWPGLLYLTISGAAALINFVPNATILVASVFVFIVLSAGVFRYRILASEGVENPKSSHMLCFWCVVFACAMAPNMLLGPRAS